MSSAVKLNTKSTYDAGTKTWSGPKIPLKFDEQQIIGPAALKSLRKNPKHIAQICHHNGKQYTNEEIATFSVRVAQNLRQEGLKEGDFIGICAANTDFLAPLFFGSMLEGLVVSTLDPSFEKDGIKHIYSLTRPKMMFCDGSIYERVKQAFEEMDLSAIIYTMQEHLDGVPQITELLKETGSEKNYKPATLKNGGESLASIVCSSGTTGLPKGVCLSHSSLLNAEFLFYGALKESDKLVSFSTLYWLSGVLTLLHGTLAGATRIINSKGFSPTAFFEIIQNYKATATFTPPSQIAMSVASKEIQNFDLSSLKLYLTGGSAIPYAIIQQIIPYIPECEIIAGYGMSEIAGAISLGPINSNGSNGQLAPYIDAKVINSDGKPLEPNEVGEICVRTSFKWDGYYKNPEATKETIDSEGWIHSGDLGYISEEGNIHVIDRMKEILKYNNFHFYPTEIEKCVSQIPGVCEVCVCGIPDIVSSFLPTAAIVKASDSSLSEEEVYNHVAKNMDHFKQLRGGVYFVNELPKTPSGKNLRREVVKICEVLRKDRVSAA